MPNDADSKLTQETTHIRELLKVELEHTGIKIGFRGLGTCECLWPGYVHLFYNRPGYYASVLATNIIYSIAIEQKRPVYYAVQPGSSQHELLHRLVSCCYWKFERELDDESKIVLDEKAIGFDWDAAKSLHDRLCEQQTDALNASPIYFQKKRLASPADLLREAEQVLASEGDLGLFVIDPIEELGVLAELNNRDPQSAYQHLKSMSRFLSVPIVCVANIPKLPGEGQDDARHLRNAGLNEKHFDFISLLEKIDQPEGDADWESNDVSFQLSTRMRYQSFYKFYPLDFDGNFCFTEPESETETESETEPQSETKECSGDYIHLPSGRKWEIGSLGLRSSQIDGDHVESQPENPLDPKHDTSSLIQNEASEADDVPF